MVKNIPRVSQFIGLIQNVYIYVHCWYKRISLHATMKHLNSFTEGNLTHFLGLSTSTHKHLNSLTHIT